MGDAVSADDKLREARAAYLILDGWAGITRTPCRVLGETPKKFRIMPYDMPIKLGGRGRWLNPGCTALVPKCAITLAEQQT